MNNSFNKAFYAFALLSAGAFLGIFVIELLNWGTSPEVPVMWWLGRSTGVLGYMAAWLSTLFGVLVAGKSVPTSVLDRGVVLELHRQWSIATLIVMVLHVFLIVGNSHSGVSALAALIPLASTTLRGPVTLGTLACWGFLALAITTAFYRQLPNWAWRAVHASAFGTFVLVLVHGLYAGTDSQALWVKGMYGITVGILSFAILYRVHTALSSEVVEAEPS